nr:hypothetical protein [Tanacetum cinerariifolium]
MLFTMPSCKQVNPPYKFKWTEKTVLVAEGSSETTIEGYMENYKNISQDIRDQLNAEAKAVKIILTGIDNDIYSIVDACPNACEIGKPIVNSPPPTYDQEPTMVTEDDEMSKEKEIDKLMDLISLSFKKIYKPTNNNLKTSSNTNRANQDNTLRINKGIRANQDNTLRINKGIRYDNQRVVNVVRARENVGIHVVQQSRIQCYNCKKYGHVAMECQKLKRANDAAYHKEKMLLYQELEVHYMYMAQIQEVTSDAADNFGPIFDAEPLQKDDDDLVKERDLLASLIKKLKCEIDNSKNRNKLLGSTNKTLINKLKETISIISQEKEAQKKFHKTREDKELEKDIALENKIKVLDDIIYKTGQLVQTMNMLNRNCKTSFVKPEFLKKAQRANPRLYDIGCYNDNLALMLAPESDKTIRLAQES